MNIFRSRNSATVHAFANKYEKGVNPPGAPYGLYIIDNWITEDEEFELCKAIGKNEWAAHMSAKRPTQHLGYKYNRTGVLNTHKKIAGDWGLLETYKERLEKEMPGISITQGLVNYYHKSTGIGAHTDTETDLVFGISIAGDANMIWSRLMMDPLTGQAQEIKYETCVRRRSLYIMVDEIATLWKHRIPVRSKVYYPEYNPNSPNYTKLVHTLNKGDDYGRASITFRDIIIEK
jgi:alkylated DNA repair dioxygenase AlkB